MRRNKLADMIRRMVMCMTLVLLASGMCCAQDGSSEFPEEDWPEDWSELPDSARRMLWHTGIVKEMGLDMAVSDKRHDYAANVSVGLRLKGPRLTMGVGLSPGSRSRSREGTGGVSISGSEGNVSVSHQIDDSEFAMPAYVFAQWELLPERASPVVQVRAGSIIDQRGERNEYYHISLGCRVALERVAIRPFTGATWDYGSGSAPMGSFGLSVTF